MADITVLHNARCSTSRAALEAAREAGVDVDVREYLKEPLTRAEVLDLLAVLDDAPGELVRRDATWTELGLTEADVDSPEKVADVIAATPKIMQRPVLVRAGRAIIGRPKDRVPTFLVG